MKWKTLLFVLVGSASITAGAEAPRPAAESKIAPASTRPPTSPQPSARATSPTTSARLSDSLPKFSPSAKAETPAAKPGEPVAAVESQEPEIPRNSIILLPQYDVRDETLPKFSERELLTPEGRAELALRRHPGLKFGPFSFLNVRRGLEMLEEEDAVDRRQEMMELVRFGEGVERTLPQNPATGARTNPTQPATPAE